VNSGKNTGVVTILFTDIEGSSLLWEQNPDRMRVALVRHDTLLRTVVESNRGVVVKMLGDGMHAAFEDPLDAVAATVQLQQALTAPIATNGLALRIRCGLHVGVVERRDNDYFGSTRQSCSPYHERGAWGTGPAVAVRRRFDQRSIATCGVIARPRQGSLARSGTRGARLSAHAFAAPTGFPTAALT
jgi:Adenylate and Guanylate cyclase catalytic domain